MTTGFSKPCVILARGKSCFCVDCIVNNRDTHCQNIANGYVLQWDMKYFITMPPYKDSDIIDIHDPLYSVDYERVSDLVVTGACMHSL